LAPPSTQPAAPSETEQPAAPSASESLEKYKDAKVRTQEAAAELKRKTEQVASQKVAEEKKEAPSGACSDVRDSAHSSQAVPMTLERTKPTQTELLESDVEDADERWADKAVLPEVVLLPDPAGPSPSRKDVLTSELARRLDIVVCAGQPAALEPASLEVQQQQEVQDQIHFYEVSDLVPGPFYNADDSSNPQNLIHVKSHCHSFLMFSICA